MRKILLAGVGAAALLAAGAASAATTTKPAAPAAKAAAGKSAPATRNPLLRPWTGKYGGFPPFDQVKVADFKPALELAMAENLREVDAIANNKAKPTFENTIAAMERSGSALTRAVRIYGIWRSNLSTPEFQAVQNEMDPKLAAFQDKVYQNEKLFRRIEAVYNSPEKAKLTPEQQRLTWWYWNTFVRAGAKLSPADKAKVTDINQQLAGLYAKFSQHLQADESTAIFLKASDLAGLPDSVKDAAAAAAEEKGHKGEYAILNTRSSMEPFLTYSDRRDLREKVWRTYYSRGDNGDVHDNNAIITQILHLRAERAKLLGYPTHAHWRLADKMAKTPENAMNLMMQVWPATVARIRQEVADMQAVADKEGAGIKIAAWDYRYYAEKVRKAKYDLDENQIKPYLQLDNVRKAMFWEAGQLYGFTFTPVTGVPTFHKDVVVYEVKNAAGQHVALWYFDPYAREGKDSGAWENAYRTQDKLDGIHPPIVSNNSNFIKGKPGEPILISWDDAETMFHEFGHALHEMNSNVVYPTLAGTNTATDFVEFPSQLNENWLPTKEVMKRFLVNAKGEPMPDELAAKIQKASTFNEGFKVGEYLVAALVDMKLHLAGDQKIDPDAFEREMTKELGMPEEIVMRHRTPQFGHIFSGDDYSAGYYSYLWSEVLDHDAFEAFTEAGGPYDKAVAKRLHDTIMSVGGTVDPADAYRNFRGRDPKIDAYLRSKGFPLPGQTAAQPAAK
jgi:peptidyl-dipeptidase Dcp